MKILIIGAGILGCTYAWQLTEAGNEVSVLVRKGKKTLIESNGFLIKCTDMRKGKPIITETIFRPPVIETLDSSNEYQLIMICVKSNQLESILPLLSGQTGKANILFFQNNWFGDISIRKFVNSSDYLFGFSRVIGGWKKDNVIECIIFSSRGMNTMIGEVDGKETPRIKEIHNMFATAGMRPKISYDILGWLNTHYVEYIGPVGSILKAGSAKIFSKNNKLIKESILATREGLEVCRARGINVNKSAPGNLKLFRLPLFLLVPVARLNYRMPTIRQFFEESIAGNIDEIKNQYKNIISEADRLNVNTPVLKSYRSLLEI